MTQHDVFHAGAPVDAGEKWVMRTGRCCWVRLGLHTLPTYCILCCGGGFRRDVRTSVPLSNTKVALVIVAVMVWCM